MSWHIISTITLFAMIGLFFWELRAEMRFRRIRRALSETMHALVTESALATELQMDRRRAMGIDLRRHSVSIAMWIAGL